MDDFDEKAGRGGRNRDSVPPLRPLDRKSEQQINLSTVLDKRREEKIALLEERVTPIVQDYMARYEALFHEKKNFTDNDDEERWLAWAALLRTAQLALLLADSAAAARLLPLVKDTRRFRRYPEDDVIGRLSLVVGDVETATALIERSMAAQEPNDSYFFYMEAARIAADLPDTTLAKQLLLEMERQGKQRDKVGLIDQAVEIAFRIGDATTLTRIIQQAERVRVYYTAAEYRLSLFAPYHPEAAERLMLRQLAEYAESKERSQWNLARIGETAAVLGDSDTARAIMETLKDQRFFTHVSEIAAVLGDVETAEEMMWAARRTGQWKGYHFDHFTAAWHNPGAAYYLMNALRQEGYEIGVRAVDILEWGCKGKWITEFSRAERLRRM